MDSQGDRLSEGSLRGENYDDSEEDSDGEWENNDESRDVVTEYNTLQLRRFSR